jgi:putative AdoMet-dependent methyltransferase
MMDWMYDEFRQVGVDFGSEQEVLAYDEKYRAMRDLDAEAARIAEALCCTPESDLLEIGAGTGEIALRLAARCRRVTAVDVSTLMLDVARKKAAEQGVGNVEFLRAGFLHLTEMPQRYHAAVSQLALHHLPDAWKAVAMRNVFDRLHPGGRFWLLDSMLSFPPERFSEAIPSLIALARSIGGERIAQEIVTNIRDEYPTWNWIVKGMLTRVGFEIISTTKYTDVMSMFVCLKPE